MTAAFENAFNANAACIHARIVTEAAMELRHLLCRVAAGQIVGDAILERAACDAWFDYVIRW